MTQFEKAVINELQGIKKELQKMNKKESPPGQVDGVNVQLDEQAISNALAKTLHGARITHEL